MSAESLLLPQEKTPKTLSATTAKVFLYGEHKIGKTTLCAGLDPDHTLFLATEPGHGGIEAFEMPVNDWPGYRAACAALTAEAHGFTTVVVDTADMLFAMCQKEAMAELGTAHPSDLEYGKGWDAVNKKWRDGVGYLASLGLGVWFISHAKNEEISQRVGKITKTVPTLTGKAREFLLQFCDYIFFAQIEASPDGERRVLRTKPSENWEAGTRIELPDPLPLDSLAVKQAIEQATA